MFVSSFREFESYAGLVGDADLRMSLPRLHGRSWSLEAVSVGALHLQVGSEGSGNITEGVPRQGGPVLFVPTAGFHRANGQPMDDGSVLVLWPGCEFTISVLEAHDWFSLYLPFELLNPEPVESYARQAIRPLTRVVEAGPTQATQLRKLVAMARASIQAEPAVLSSLAALNSLQTDLLAACRPIVSLPPPAVRKQGRAQLPRGELVRTVRELVERQPDGDLTIEDLAAAADVSERTLRNVFLDYFGVAPRRYLTLRRLHQARAVLRASTQEATTVTAVAARFGFWHFGRFASEYRRLFGERPSETLSRR